MVQRTDAFLRDFIGCHQAQIKNLDIEWEPDTGSTVSERRKGQRDVLDQVGEPLKVCGF